MFQSVLVPVDQSEFGEHSLPTAVALASKSGAELHLVHVHVPHVPDHMLSNTQYMYEGLDLDEYDLRHRGEAEKYLDQLAGRLSGPLHSRPSTTVLDGPVSEAIQRFADQSKTDLIVITRHSQAGVGGAWRKSVTDALAREMTQPILVLHPVGRNGEVFEPTQLDKVLVCLDGSEACEAILEPVRDLAQLGARLTLLHVVPVRPSNAPDWEKQDTVDRMQDYLQSTAQKLADDCPSVRFQVERARSPARGIMDVARDLDVNLIALGTHGHGRLHRLLVGSVADEVLQDSPLPVLIKRPPARG